MNYQRATLAVFLAVSGNGISSVGAFSPPSSSAAPPGVATTQKNMVATAPPMPGTANGSSSSSSDAPLGWECDDEANCVQVPACDEEGCRTSLDVRIHNEWYDLSGESVCIVGIARAAPAAAVRFILGALDLPFRVHCFFFYVTRYDRMAQGSSCWSPLD